MKSNLFFLPENYVKTIEFHFSRSSQIIGTMTFRQIHQTSRQSHLTDIKRNLAVELLPPFAIMYIFLYIVIEGSFGTRVPI